MQTDLFPVFKNLSEGQFNDLALDIFRYQFDNNAIYNRYCNLIRKTNPTSVNEIPFLPISFFKQFEIKSNNNPAQIVFTSSGTTSAATSSHIVTDTSVYDRSLDSSYKKTYGNHEDYVILALLPHYLERTGSSLVYMAQRWIGKSKHPESGFYLDEIEKLAAVLKNLARENKKVILIGVTFALLQLAEILTFDLSQTIIIETGGMKGLRKEIIKQELHAILRKSFLNANIQSEYGMTELLSQAYAPDGINFICPPWMRVLIRETNDPLQLSSIGKTGGINVIDLANYNSCSFIATQDLGKQTTNNTFQVLGRFDHSDIRGCNLMSL